MSEFVRDIDRNLYSLLKTYNIHKEDREELLTLIDDHRPVIVDLMVAAYLVLKMTDNTIDTNIGHVVETSTKYMKKAHLYDASILYRTVLKYCYLIRKKRGFNDF